MKHELDLATLELPSSHDFLAQLEQQAQCRLNGRVYDFQLLMRDEGLVLRGRARTYHAKQLAQHVVMEIARRSILANEIEVL